MLLSVLRGLGSGIRPVRAPGESELHSIDGRGVSDTPDETLVERVLAGDRRAASDLYRRHVAYLIGMAVRMSRSRSDGEDIVQETFAIALERLVQLREPSAFRSWAAQISVSLVRRRIRKRRVLAAIGLGTGQAEGGDDATLESLCPASSGEVRAELALIDVVLAALPAEQRVAWMLRYVEGEELETVATLCGCSLATAKRRIAAARARVSAHVTIDEGA